MSQQDEGGRHGKEGQSHNDAAALAAGTSCNAIAKSIEVAGLASDIFRMGLVNRHLGPLLESHLHAIPEGSGAGSVGIRLKLSAIARMAKLSRRLHY